MKKTQGADLKKQRVLENCKKRNKYCTLEDSLPDSAGIVSGCVE